MDEHLILYFFVLVVGACIGSFLNVVALRAISKESIVLPPSKCPKCNSPIKWYDNIPVLSYFLTFRGKCRSCGEKVSLQYPVVEALTAILFLIIFMAFGISLKTLILMVLVSISIVICITDIKEEAVYDVHSWIFIIAALIYSYFEHGMQFALIGLLGAAIIMEIIARSTYYLIRKKENKEESENTENTDNTDNKETEEETKEEEISKTSEENLDINSYVSKYKRAFGEGDTYLAAGAGALLGIKYFIVAVAAAIIIQAICILPQFLINLYKQKEIRLLVSILSFSVLAIIYFVTSNIVTLPFYAVIILVVALIYFAIDAITRLKKTVNQEGFNAIPFGPALLTATYLILFFGPVIISLIRRFIFMV